MLNTIKKLFGLTTDPSMCLEKLKQAKSGLARDANRLNFDIKNLDKEISDLKKGNRITEAISRLQRRPDLENARTGILRNIDILQKGIDVIQKAEGVSVTEDALSMAAKVISEYNINANKIVSNLDKLDQFDMRMDVLSQQFEVSSNSNYTNDELMEMLSKYESNPSSGSTPSAEKELATTVEASIKSVTITNPSSLPEVHEVKSSSSQKLLNLANEIM